MLFNMAIMTKMSPAMFKESLLEILGIKTQVALSAADNEDTPTPTSISPASSNIGTRPAIDISQQRNQTVRGEISAVNNQPVPIQPPIPNVTMVTNITVPAGLPNLDRTFLNGFIDTIDTAQAKMLETMLNQQLRPAANQINR
jgi:hypothetical protein